MQIYGEHALAERTCQKWFARFKSGDFGLEDEERPGQPKRFEDEELEALLDQDGCKTQEELAESLGVTQATPKQKLTIGPTSIQRRIPTSDCRRTVEMITMYCVGTTPVSNVVSILVTNIFSTLAVNISKILVIHLYYQIHVLRLKIFFKQD